MRYAVGTVLIWILLLVVVWYLVREDRSAFGVRRTEWSPECERWSHDWHQRLGHPIGTPWSPVGVMVQVGGNSSARVFFVECLEWEVWVDAMPLVDGVVDLLWLDTPTPLEWLHTIDTRRTPLRVVVVAERSEATDGSVSAWMEQHWMYWNTRFEREWNVWMRQV